MSLDDRPIPDLGGRVAVVTGANRGVGLDVARLLAGHGAMVVLACRDAAKAEVARREVDAARSGPPCRVVPLELDRLGSVRAGAGKVLAWDLPIDLLVNNAAALEDVSAATSDGFDRHLGVNHLGHVALTAALLPGLEAAERARVVTVTSRAHRFGRLDLDQMSSAGRTSPMRAYAASKLANLLFAYELDRRLAANGSSVTSVAASPGGDGLVHPVEGADPIVRAAVDLRVRGGDHVAPDGPGEVDGPAAVRPTSARSQDRDLARHLWDRSNDVAGVRWPFDAG